MKKVKKSVRAAELHAKQLLTVIGSSGYMVSWGDDDVPPPPPGDGEETVRSNG